MNKILLALLLLSSLSINAQDDLPMEEGAPPVLEESIYADDPATPTTPANISDAPDISKKVDEDNTPKEAMVPMDNPAPGVTPEQSLEAEVKPKRVFNARASHWYSTFGFEAMEYELPFAYVGTKEALKPENRKLYGGRLGLGREFYIGKGLMTSTRLEGYYMGTLFESAKTADPTLQNTDVATTKKSGQIYGFEAVQTLSYLWDIKTKNPFMDTWSNLFLEPFVEAGFGKASAFNKIDYKYDTSPVVLEEHEQNFTDELTNFKMGAGIMLTSNRGFFSYFKVTQNSYDITKRKSRVHTYPDNGTPSRQILTLPNPKIDPIFVYSVGGGYKF